LAFSYVSTPRVITVDKNPAYPIAIEELKEEKRMPESIEIRQVKYLNNLVQFKEKEGFLSGKIYEVDG